MRNKCLFALGVVFAMSLTSIVAFAFSFTGEPEAKNDLRQIIAVASVAESKEPTTEQTTVPAESEETTATLQPSDSSLLGSIDWDVEDAYMLAKIAMAEAESEDTEGKALVMLVVLNRVWSDEFPDTIAGVIGFIGDMQDWKKLKYFREFIPYLIDEIQVDDSSCLFTS